MAGSAAEARRQPPHQKGHGDLGDDRQHQQHKHQACQRLFRKAARRRLAFALQRLGEQGHKGGVEGTLAKQAAKQVWKAESHEKGIGHRAGAQGRGNQDVAYEAKHAAEQVSPPTVAKAR